MVGPDDLKSLFQPMISYVKLQKIMVLISDFCNFREKKQLARYFWSFPEAQINWDPTGSRLKHDFCLSLQAKRSLTKTCILILSE